MISSKPPYSSQPTSIGATAMVAVTIHVESALFSIFVEHAFIQHVLLHFISTFF